MATGNGNAYTGNTLELSQNGTNFVRLLGHELGHFYDHQLKNDATALDLVDNFADIIKYEMDESQATAISYIIRKQIMLNGGPDIEISNLYNLTQTAIDNIRVNELLNLYPNPVKKDLYIKTLSEKSVIKIYSLQGSLLITLSAYRSNDQIDLSSLQSGVYLVKISGPDGNVYAGKFVKE